MMSNTPNIEALRKVAEEATPTFGDVVENGWASEDNPTRKGFFVRAFKRTGRMNPGLTWEITDGKGKFWELQPRVIDERLIVRPAEAALASLKEERDEAIRERNECIDGCVEIARQRSAAEQALSVLKGEVLEKVGPLTEFSWSAVTADCEEARVYLTSLIDGARSLYDKLSSIEEFPELPGGDVKNAAGEAAGSGAALLREARTALFALCEDTEERMFDRLQALGLTDHEQGFLRGSKSEAKAIGRAMGEVFRDLLQRVEDQS